MTPESSMMQPTQGAFTRLAEYIVHSGQAGVMVLAAVVMVIAVSVWLALRPQLFAAIAVDARTGRVLFARNADAPRLPASITKVMTAYMLFREIRKGRYRLSSRLVISRHAASMQPSKLGLKPGSTITVDHALRAILTKSANDIAVAIAENIAGSESRFARRMTQVARSMGMTRTTFRNASGLPRPKNVTTARDLATLALRIQRDFPRLYKRYFGLRHFRFRGHVYRNHNRLLGRVKGMDGLKTGYTRAAGYNLAASARRNGRRVVAVVLGAPTSRARNAYMARLIERMFRTQKLKRGTMIAAVAGTPPGWNARKTRLAASTDGGRRNVRLPRPALAGLVRKVTAPVPQPRPDGIARLAMLARNDDGVGAGAGKEREKASPAPKKGKDRESMTLEVREKGAPGPSPSIGRAATAAHKVEGRIFASVKPGPVPEERNEASGPVREQPGAAGREAATKVASLAGVTAMQVRPESSDAAGAQNTGRDAAENISESANETVITKSDALLPVSALLRPRRVVAPEPSRTEENPVASATSNVPAGPENALPHSPKSDDREAVDNNVQDRNSTDRRLVTASVTTEEKRLADAHELQDPELERRLSSWNIQLGSFPAHDGARKRLDEAMRKFRPLLRGKEGFTMVFRKGGRTYYRARFAGFDRRTALRACRMMKRRGISCFALAPSANRS